MDNVVYTGNILISSNKHKSKKKYFGVLYQSGLFKFFKDEKKVDKNIFFFFFLINKKKKKKKEEKNINYYYFFFLSFILYKSFSMKFNFQNFFFTIYTL